MNLANIYPVKNQELYKDEKFVMILAHLLKKGLYNKENFNEKQYIIIDNGLYEEEQISTSLEPIISLVKDSSIPVREIIVPDVINNTQETIKLFEENIEVMKKYNEYRYMFVAQATTFEELRCMINYINTYYGSLNISVGISKLSPLDRSADEAIAIYKNCKFPIHFLGLKESFEELVKVTDVIRSCDSSQLAYIAKNEEYCPLSLLTYKRSGRREDGRGIEGVDIDLEKDELNNSKILTLKTRLPNFKTRFEKYEDFVKNNASPKYTKELSIIGLVGEVGELADVVKKETIYEDMSKFVNKYGMSVKDKIIDEAGDVLWQYVLILSMYGLSLDEVMRNNVRKLINRHGDSGTAKDGGGER